MFALLLTVLFIALKLTNQIDWSWWLVFLPLYFLRAFVVSLRIIASLIVWLSSKRLPSFKITRKK